MINERIYLEEGNENVYLDVYVADRLGDYVRDAILIIPGGGFYMVSDIESEPVAMAFMPYGFNAFVLNYSVTAKEKRAFPAHLIQASLASAYVDNGLKFELHVYPGKGNHGVALANEMTSCSNEKSVDGAMAKWVENAVIWSKGIK